MTLAEGVGGEHVRGDPDRAEGRHQELAGLVAGAAGVGQARRPAEPREQVAETASLLIEPCGDVPHRPRHGVQLAQLSPRVHPSHLLSAGR